MGFAPSIPGERGGRLGQDGELNRLESQEARRLGLPRPDLMRLAMIGSGGFPWEDGHAVTATLSVGSNSIAHGLGSTPSYVLPIKDEAPPVFVEAYHNAVGGTQTCAGSTIIEVDTETTDWGGDFNTGTYTFAAPHAGIYTCEAAVTLTAVADAAQVATYLSCSVLGTRWFGSHAQGASSNVAQGSALLLNLSSAETVQLGCYSTSSNTVRTGLDETRMLVSSDDAWSEGVHDSTNLTIWSKRARTITFWVSR